MTCTSSLPNNVLKDNIDKLVYVPFNFLHCNCSIHFHCGMDMITDRTGAILLPTDRHLPCTVVVVSLPVS